MTTIELPFALGVTVWHAAHYLECSWVECPECLGTRKLKVTLANGEEYELECRGCQDGYEPARGKIKRTRYRCKPLPFTPQRFRIEGDDIWYSESSPEANAYSNTPSADLFVDRDACVVRCDERNAELNKQESARELQNLMHKRKDYAWSVHYWRGQLADKRKEIERIEARLVEISARKRSTSIQAGQHD